MENELMPIEEEDNLIFCHNCYGDGRIIVGEHYVTPEMAIESGVPESEGMFYCYEYAACTSCNGTGLVEKVDEYEQNLQKEN